MGVNRNGGIVRIAENCVLDISDSGEAVLSPDLWHAENVVSPYTRLYFVSEGEGGYLRDSRGTIKMHPNRIYLIPPMYRFDYGCTGKVRKIFFHINIIRADGFDVFRDFGMIGFIEDSQKVADAVRFYREKDVFSALGVKGVIFSTLAEIAEEYGFGIGDDFGAKYSELTKMMLAYVKEHLSASLTRSEIASHFGVSENTVSNYFKREVGMTVRRYVEELVFAEAQKKLAYSSKTIGEISDELGFCDRFYFSRRFGQLFFCPPSDFRRKSQSEYREPQFEDDPSV